MSEKTMEAMDAIMKAGFDAIQPQQKPRDVQYVTQEKFQCPSCLETKEHRIGDMLLCDVYICDDCVTQELERIAVFVEANYDDVVARMKAAQAARKAG